MKAVIQANVFNQNGAVSVAPNASIAIRDPDSGALIQLYEDRDGNGNPGNPFLADSRGFFRVYADPGTYHVYVTTVAGTQTYLDVPFLNNTLTSLSDVDPSGLRDGDAFVYDSATSKFIPRRLTASLNDIGAPGNQGFGVGICPDDYATAGFSALVGADDPASANYGNYQYTDGSIMCWIPAFYYRIGHASNPTYSTYGVNSIDVRPLSAFLNLAQANAEGYALHRAFYDGGAAQQGFFIDKYQCSNNGGVASSIKDGNPLSSNAAHNPFSELDGAPTNNYSGAFAAAKTRGAAFFPAMRYMHAALALLATAHAQAATSAYCAWYDADGVTNFPKGCNNNALGDTNDAEVTYTSDGYDNAGKTGSGVPFAKTTHNGQACGVADLNGNMWEISPGLTCVAADKAITGATQTNPVALTVAGHGLATGALVHVTGVGGMTQINERIYTVTVVDPDTVTLDGCDGTAFTAYTSGGTLTSGTFYALNTSASAADLTGSNALATDAFGPTGVAAHSAAIVPAFRTDYSNNTFARRYGNGAAQVLSGAVSGDDWMRASLGLPAAAVSSAGTNLFGQDHFYQYIRNELCPLAGGNRGDGLDAGVWALGLSSRRGSSSGNVGLRSACYLG